MKRLLFFLLLVSSAHATTYTATDGGQSAVASAIALATNDGDIVIIPADNKTWASGVTVSKGITIQGAGGGWAKGSSTDSITIGTGSKTFNVQGGLGFVTSESVRAVQKSDGATNFMQGTVTSYTDNVTSGVLVVNVTSTGGSGTFNAWNFVQPGLTQITHNAGTSTLFTLNESSTNNIRVTGINFIRGTGTGRFVEIPSTSITNQPVVFTYCQFQELDTLNTPIVFHSSSKHGVVSHCYFHTGFNWTHGANVTAQAFSFDIQGGGSDANSQATWTQPSAWGMLDTNGNKCFYIEDCWIMGYWSQATNVDGGIRAVIRHTYYDNSGGSSHGIDSTCYGMRTLEEYNNTFIHDFIHIPSGCSGGGCTRISANIPYFWFQRGGSSIWHDNVFPSSTNQDYPTKAIVLTAEQLQRNIGPTSCWGAPGSGQVYPCPRQVGMGYTDGTHGTTLPQGNNCIAIYTGDPEPCYQWNNSGTGNYASPAINNYGCGNPNACPNCANQPDISTYIKVGRDWLNATKPSYTAYTYPHPLVAGPIILPPPKDLHVAKNLSLLGSPK
jgi:hypothetical protein